MSNEKKDILIGAFVALLARVAGAGLQFLFNVVLGRVLGADGVGLYFLSFTIVSLGQVIARLGIDAALVKYVAATDASGDQFRMRAFVSTGVSYVLGCSIIISLLIVVVAPFIAASVFSDERLVLGIRIMAISIVPFSLMMVFTESLRALRHIAWSQIIQVALPQAFLLLGVYFGYSLLGKSVAQISYVISCAIAFLFSLVLWRKAYSQVKKANEALKISGDFCFRDELLNTSIPLMWVSSLHFVNGWIATFVIGMLEAPAEAGIFNAAQRTAQLTTLVLIAVNAIAAPKFSALYHQGRIDQLERFGIFSTRIMCIASAPLFFIGFMYPGSIMGFFGPDFHAGSNILMILLFAGMVNVATGSVGQILAMAGGEKQLRNVIFVSALLNTFATILLGHYFGVMGVAMGMLLGSFYSSFRATWAVKKRFGIAIHLFRKLPVDR